MLLLEIIIIGIILRLVFRISFLFPLPPRNRHLKLVFVPRLLKIISLVELLKLHLRRGVLPVKLTLIIVRSLLLGGIILPLLLVFLAFPLFIAAKAALIFFALDIDKFFILTFLLKIVHSLVVVERTE